MEELIQKIVRLGSHTRHTLETNDEILQIDLKDAEDIERRVDGFELEEERLVIYDFIACKETGWSRKADLAYLAGITDTLSVLENMGIIDKSKM
ncbi:MAG: hypothetical protein Q4B70_13440 [Lachnospiraceae bacterium]|nr:hypothetical protein [Lachnospiraceae bacterium]